MRGILFVLGVWVTITAKAQVYTFTPWLKCESFWSGEKHPVLWFDRVEMDANLPFTVNLDNKTITHKLYGMQQTINISNISRDAANVFTLDIKLTKDDDLAWEFWRFKLNEKGEAVYLQRAEKHKGRDFKRDTFFTMYTNDAAEVAVTLYAEHAKNVEGVNAINTKQGDSVFAASFTSEINYFDIRNRIFTWIEGDAKKGTRHTWPITEGKVIKSSSSSGIEYTCPVSGNTYYIVSYAYSKNTVERNPYFGDHYILMNKYVDGKMVSSQAYRY